MNHLTSIATTANTEQSNQHVQTHTTIKKHYFFKVPGIMKLLLSITAAALLIVPQTMVVAYSFPSAPTTTTTNNRDTATTQTHMHWTTRRTALASLVTAVLGTTTQVAHASDSSIAGGSSSSGSTSNSKNEAVYFGVGCFWHIQHELVQAERDLLKRSDRELTSVTGYAGGRAAGSAGRVCYHNFQRVADYGELGHGEVVGLQLPTDKIVEFAAVYFSLFNPKTLGQCVLFLLFVLLFGTKRDMEETTSLTAVLNCSLV